MKKVWEIKKLGDVCETSSGGTPLKSKKEYYTNGTIPWLLSGEVSQGEITKANSFITEQGLNNSSAKLFPKNSVLVAMYGATAGQVGILRFQSATNQAICAVLPNKSITPEFLFYFFLQNKTHLAAQAIGNAQPNISQEKIRNLILPLPPLPEQKRIVSLLDQCFSAIDRAKSIAEKNLQNAKELFESYLNGIFENSGEDWEVGTIEEVCTEIFAGGDAPKDNFSEHRTNKFNIPIYANSVKDKGLYGYTNISRVNEPSITIAARGSGTGHTELRNESYFPIVRLIVLIPKSEIINLEFLKYKIDTLEILRSGSAIPQLTVPMIKEYKIPLFSLSDQKKIVSKLDDLKTETQQLENHYKKKIEDLEELKKSILQKAFSGEL